MRPLEEYCDDSAAVGTRSVEGRNEDPDLGAERDGDANEGGPIDQEDGDEEVGTY